MTFKMIHADQRERQTIGQPFGVVESDQERTCQTRSLCHRDGPEVMPGKMCFNQRGLDNPVNGAQMGASSEFRHHSAELAMHRVL